MNAAGAGRRFRLRTAEGDSEREVDLATVAVLRHDDGRAVIRIGDDLPSRVQIGTDRRNGSNRRIEVVVDGWRFELEVEDDARASLRRRATRDRDASNASGPLEIRAIIPGRVAAVRVAVGDQVEAGAGLLVVEAMKMQNELRVPRAGTVDRVAVGAGDTIELGDLLVVLR